MKNLLALALCSFALSFMACKSAPKAEEAAAAPAATESEHGCAECKGDHDKCKDHGKMAHKCDHKNKDKKTGKCKDCKS